MKKNKLIFVLLCSLFVFPLFVKGQTEADKPMTINNKQSIFDFDAGCDLMSRYIWRGIEFSGNAPSIQPAASMSIKGFSLGFWGAYTIAPSAVFQEFDFVISQSFLNEMFTLTYTDYYFTDYTQNIEYFEYEQDKTSHVLEGVFSFNGTKSVPLTFMAAFNFYGADAKRIESDPNSDNFNQSTGLQYSNYFELGYSKSFKTASFNAFVGGTINNLETENTGTGYLGERGYYANDKSGIINVGCKISKDIQITDKYSLPISTTLVFNPMSQKSYLVFGISL